MSPLDLGDCARVAVVDRDNGALLRGIEDIAVDAAAGLAYLSAYDRWGTDAAADARQETLPQGGIYVLRAEDLDTARGRLTVEDATGDFKALNDLHPHGVDFLAGENGHGTVAVINRRYARALPGDGYAFETTLEIFTTDGDALSHRLTVRHPLLCRANEVVLLSDDVALISRDHSACSSGGVLLEDARGELGIYRGEVVRLTLSRTGDPPQAEIVASRVGFANGLVVDRTLRRLYVSATREKAIHIYDMSGAPAETELRLRQRVAVPGGPDNLALLPSGEIVVPLHPNLIVTALYLYRWTDRAPSRIVRWNPKDGAPSARWDDSGRLLAAATVATPIVDKLLIGSVADGGLAVCTIAPGD